MKQELPTHDTESESDYTFLIREYNTRTIKSKHHEKCDGKDDAKRKGTKWAKLVCGKPTGKWDGWWSWSKTIDDNHYLQVCNSGPDHPIE